MAFFKFIGDPRDGSGPHTIDFYGRTFHRDRGTEVTDAAQIKKLQGNRHFQEVGSGEDVGGLASADSAPIGDDERARMEAAFDRLEAALRGANDRIAEVEAACAAAEQRANAAEARASKAEADLLEALTAPPKGEGEGETSGNGSA